MEIDRELNPCGIDTLNVSQFGSLKGQSYSFSPQLNIVYGLNESGKSSLLNAVACIYDGFGQRYDQNQFMNWHEPYIMISARVMLPENCKITRSLSGKMTGELQYCDTEIRKKIGNKPLTVSPQEQAIDRMLWHISGDVVAGYLALSKLTTWQEVLMRVLLPDEFKHFPGVIGAIQSQKKALYTNHAHSKSRLSMRQKEIRTLKETWQRLKEREIEDAKMHFALQAEMVKIEALKQEKQELQEICLHHQIHYPKLLRQRQYLMIKGQTESEQSLVRAKSPLIDQLKALELRKGRELQEQSTLISRSNQLAEEMGYAASQRDPLISLMFQLRVKGEDVALEQLLEKKFALLEKIEGDQIEMHAEFGSHNLPSSQAFERAIYTWRHELELRHLKAAQQRFKINASLLCLFTSLLWGGYLFARLRNEIGNIHQVLMGSAATMTLLLVVFLGRELLVKVNTSVNPSVKSSAKSSAKSSVEEAQIILNASHFGMLMLASQRVFSDQDMAKLLSIASRLNHLEALKGQMATIDDEIRQISMQFLNEDQGLRLCSLKAKDASALIVQFKAQSLIENDKRSQLVQIKQSEERNALNLQRTKDELSTWGEQAILLYGTTDINHMAILQMQAINKLSQLHAFEEQDPDLSVLSQDVASAEAILNNREMPTLSLLEAQAQLQEKENALHEAIERAAKLQQVIQEIPLQTAKDYEEQIIKQTQMLQSEQMSYDALTLLEQVLINAQKSLIASHQPLFIEKANGYIQHITEGSMSGLQIDEHGDLYGIKEQVVQRIPLSQLSMGTLALLIVFLKLAILESIDVEAKIPLLLDDVLSFVDDRRHGFTLEILNNLPSGRQVLLATASQAIADKGRAMNIPILTLSGLDNSKSYDTIKGEFQVDLISS